MTLSKLEELAFKVAASAPEHANATAYGAKIPWSVIHELRHELEASGYDWRSAVRSRVEEHREWGRQHAARVAFNRTHEDDRCERRVQ